MAVIGNSPATTGTTVTAQSFNGDASTVAFTLSRSVNSTVDLEVLVDNVQQSPYDSSYSVSGTTLTFSEAPASGTNNIYVIYRGATIATAQVIPDDGSVSTAKLQDTAITSAKLATGVVEGAMTTQFGRRNLIINGAMQVAQRGTSTTGVTTTDGYYACDRWTSQTDTGTWTLSQSTDAPSGFAYSFKMDCTSAGTSNADEISLRTRLEGQDFQGLAYGTSDAKSITLSFWVKSNQTGTYSVVFYNQNTTQERSISASYTINAADTWEYKTATISGDTSYNFNNSNTRDFQLIFYFGAASGFTSGTYNTSAWQNADASNWVTTGIPGLGGSTSDYVNITGVQLEVGTVATPFEHRSYGEELALCQRYYWRLTQPSTDRYAIGSGMMYQTNDPRCFIKNPIVMRTKPSVEVAGNIRFERAGTSTGDVGTLAFTGEGPYGFVLYSTSGADTTTAGHGTIFYTYDQNDYIGADAEL